MTGPQQTAFSLGRKFGKHPLARRIFCLVQPVLPLNRLGRSAHCVAFTHPRPVYDPHILIVPTTPFPSLASSGLSTEAKSVLVWEMIELAREVAPSPENAWQTIVNGGARQDIGQVHGHLIHAREHPPRGDHFELARPVMDVAPWVRLFAQIHIAAERPGNGYSVVINLSDQGAATAWITQSDPA